MLSIDLTGKRAFVAGIADDKGYGWAIVRALAGAGASVCVGTWPPALRIFTKSLERGKLDLSLPGGGEIEIERIYPFDAVYDTDDSTTNYSLITSVESPDRTANTPFIVEDNGNSADFAAAANGLASLETALDGVFIPAGYAAISKAGTSNYFSTQGNAFTSRTAGTAPGRRRRSRRGGRATTSPRPRSRRSSAGAGASPRE